MMKLRFSPLHITNPKLLKMKIGKKKIYLGLKNTANFETIQ